MLCTQDGTVHTSSRADYSLDEIARVQKVRQRARAVLFLTRPLTAVALPFRVVAPIVHHDVVKTDLCALPQNVSEHGMMQETVDLCRVGGRKRLHDKNGAARDVFQDANSLLNLLRGAGLAAKAVANVAVRTYPPPSE